MNHLKELGVEVKDTAIVRYRRRTDISGERVIGKWHIVPLSEIPLLRGFEKFEIHNTVTLEEILEMLPYDMTWDTWQWQIDHCGENMEYNDGDGFCSHRETKGSILNKAYGMLCWCAENGYLNKE